MIRRIQLLFVAVCMRCALCVVRAHLNVSHEFQFFCSRVFSFYFEVNATAVVIVNAALAVRQFAMKTN